MTISNWLRVTQTRFKDAKIESYYLDSLLLLEYVSGLDRAYILAHQDQDLSIKQIEQLDGLLERRINREPIAYILGKKEFYGRDFFVDKRVLIPRPESENFIELLKKHKITHQSIADVGCGSGVLGITTKLELPTNQVTLCDIDKKALSVAKLNAKILQVNCQFLQNDLLYEHNSFSVVLANLPYVPKNLKLQPELSYEPTIALFCDNNGLALYQELWSQITKSNTCKAVLTESLVSQHQAMIDFASKANFELTSTLGLVQLFISRSL